MENNRRTEFWLNAICVCGMAFMIAYIAMEYTN